MSDIRFITLDDIFAYADLFDVWQKPDGAVCISGELRKNDYEFFVTGTDFEDALEQAYEICVEQEYMLDTILEEHDLSFNELRGLVESEVAENPVKILSPSQLTALVAVGQPFQLRTLVGDFLVTPVVESEEESFDDRLARDPDEATEEAREQAFEAATS